MILWNYHKKRLHPVLRMAASCKQRGVVVDSRPKGWTLVTLVACGVWELHGAPWGCIR